MTLDLTKILQDAEEFEKVRDATRGKKWEAMHGKDLLLIGVRDEKDAAWISLHSVDVVDFIAAAKNYDSPAIIRQLVARIKELENER